MIAGKAVKRRLVAGEEINQLIHLKRESELIPLSMTGSVY